MQGKNKYFELKNTHFPPFENVYLKCIIALFIECEAVFVDRVCSIVQIVGEAALLMS